MKKYLPALVLGSIFLSFSLSFCGYARAAGTSGFVQVATATGQSSASQSVTLTGVTSGDMLVLVTVSTDADVASISDSAHTWKLAATTRSASGYYTKMYYAPNVSAGSASPIVHFAAATYGDLYLAEYTGLQTSPDPLDVTSTNSGTAAGFSSGSATTHSANETIIGFGEYDNGSNVNSGSGFTLRSNADSNIFEDQAVSTTGSYSATFQGGSSGYAAVMAVFVQTSGSGVTQPPVTPPVTPPATSTPDTQPPTVPSGLSATAVSSSQINLSWTASTDNVGVTGYKVYRNTTQLTTTTSNSYTDTGLSASATYTYNVSAFDAAGNASAETSPVSATTQAVVTPPTTPPASGAPTLFFTDLDSGPNTGGENNDGVYVTIYGNNFGTSPTVTVGGGQALIKLEPSTYQWYQKMTIQLGPNAQSGTIIMTNTNGASNALPFTVRAGNIYFVASNGSDSNPGTLASPWATLTHARDTMVPGSTVYAETGTYLNTDDGSGWSTCLKLTNANSGTAAGNNAFVAYPGEIVSIGDANNCMDTIRGADNTGENYWTFAGFANVFGHDITFSPANSHNLRIIGNANVTCPNGNGQEGCVDIGGTADGTEYNYWVYGNNINHVGTNNSPGSVTALYHGVYLSQQMHGVQFAWNTVAYVYGGRCIQQNVNNNSSTDHSSDYDLHIHDNVIHDCQDDGIVMTTVNPALGTVEVYNNLIYNAGQGPANEEHSGAWNCLDIQGWQNSLSSGESGTIQVYNNSMYACGTYATPDYNESSGGFLYEAGNTQKTAHFYNNIIQLTTGPAGLPYMPTYDFNGAWCATESSACTDVSGANNDFFGMGTPPTNVTLTGSLNLNPQFISPSTANFTVGNTSLTGIGANLVTGSTGGSTTPPPTATPLPGDLNLDHIVNSLDFSLLNSKWGQNYPAYDLYPDGIINSLDYAIMSSNWGKTW